MAELRPYPLSALLRRAFQELQHSDALFDLPRRKFFLGDDARDLSVPFHRQRAGTALGPAAGPHTQMAQNIALSWAAGCRIMELKTVQILDELDIPRPCIDMETIGFNVEWSQELKLEESLDEYVKAWMLIRILTESGAIAPTAGFGELVFDMSVGYDLKGIQTDRVQAFIDGMIDATAVIDRLRADIPPELSQYRDLDFGSQLSSTLTLSTFHGCPPDEIERIIEFLLEEKGLHCIVKLNPTLLGPERMRELLVDTMGYSELEVPATAFENDTKWDQAVGFCERLGDKADALGLSFGVKFSNTCIVHNHRDFFPAEEKEMYMSGQPLHVLAMNLVGKFRGHFGDRFPISFSAGIDSQNFADATALGITPITVCSDLLRPGGYGRAPSYLKTLGRRMDKLGAGDIDDYVVKAYGLGAAALGDMELPAAARAVATSALEDGGDVRAALGDRYPELVSRSRLANTAHYIENVTADARYHKAKNQKAPRKLGSSLALFDCVACNKCVPVCPNDANFEFVLPTLSIAKLFAEKDGDRWAVREDGTLTIEKKKQYANFADFCNECGNCDIFCPEDGGPYIVKPRFFGNRADYDEFGEQNGFYFESAGRAFARIDGKSFEVEIAEQHTRFAGDGFDVTLSPDDAAGTLAGEASGEIDLTYLRIIEWVRQAVLLADAPNYVSAMHSVQK